MCPQASFNSSSFPIGSFKRKKVKPSFVDLNPPQTNALKVSWLDKLFRDQFIALFSQLNDGFLVLDDPIERLIFGESNSDLHCRVVIKDLSIYKQIALGGSNGAAQAYIDGLWASDNPTSLIRILIRNETLLDGIESGLNKITQSLLKIWHGRKHNSKSGSKKNIAAHYDLGNDFFRLFLDNKMMYSSALYQAGDDLETASDRKLDRICSSLKINADDHVIEIGTGWGGFACYAATATGCKVTTITISNEQFNEAQAQVKEQKLEHLVTVKLLDYRDIEGQFDKLVSIEMIEAVGHQYLDGYFAKINSLLKPNGTALIQAIVIEDDRYEQALKEVDYIKRFIFPGSFIPSYEIISRSANNNQLQHIETYDMGKSYAQTLRDWRLRFYQNNQKFDKQRYDDRFKRMWEFYLCYCEGGFEERRISVGQIMFTKTV